MCVRVRVEAGKIFRNKGGGHPEWARRLLLGWRSLNPSTHYGDLWKASENKLWKKVRFFNQQTEFFLIGSFWYFIVIVYINIILRLQKKLIIFPLFTFQLFIWINIAEPFLRGEWLTNLYLFHCFLTQVPKSCPIFLQEKHMLTLISLTVWRRG